MEEQRQAIICTIRSAAFLSHNSGTLLALPLPSHTANASATTRCGSKHPTVFVPWLTVTGRSAKEILLLLIRTIPSR